MPSERILVVRLSAMGDIIHALPAITALRAAKPDLGIGWLVEQRWAELLCACANEYVAPRSSLKPLVDWVYPANFAAWRRALFSADTWRAMSRLRDEIRKANYDRTLDLQGAIRSALAARASGAADRIGSSLPREGPATMFYTRQVDPAGAHVIEQALSIASAVAGQPLQYAEPAFPLDPAAEAWADEFGALDHGKPLAILNPGAGWGAKCWPAASYGTVAGALGKRGFAIAVNHGPGEEALAETVRESSGRVAVPVNCSISRLIAITRRARIFIGGDTGPMHLAAAMRVPVVALFGPTQPERNGPYGTASVVIRSPSSVNNSSHTDRPDEALLAISPQQVMHAVDQLLEEYGG